MDMTFTNRALSPMGDFAIQFNKNRFVEMIMMILITVCLWLLFVCFSSFGLIPGGVLTVQTPLHPNQSANTSLPINYGN